MKELLEVFGNVPVTIGMIVVFFSLSIALVNSTFKVFRIYSKINKKIDNLEALSNAAMIGSLQERFTKIENDLNKVAGKSRNSDRILLQHINSHCHQLQHMAGHLESISNYHAPTKMTLPEDMI